MTSDVHPKMSVSPVAFRRSAVAVLLGVLPACLGHARSGYCQDRPFIQVESASGLPHGILRIESGATYIDRLYLPFARVKIDELLLFDTGIS